MIANDIRQIDPARRSELAMRAARWALDYSRSETSSYTTPICCPHGSPLSPRQRHVRQQNEQADNQGFSGGGILRLSRRSRPKRWQSPFLPSYPC